MHSGALLSASVHVAEDSSSVVASTSSPLAWWRLTCANLSSLQARALCRRCVVPLWESVLDWLQHSEQLAGDLYPIVTPAIRLLHEHCPQLVEEELFPEMMDIAGGIASICL
jgi:hypothetical protein